MSIVKMTDLDLAGKRVLIREDLNVPVKDGAVTSDARIRASLPTVRWRPLPRTCPASSAATCRWSPTGSTASTWRPARR